MQLNTPAAIQLRQQRRPKGSPVHYEEVQQQRLLDRLITRRNRELLMILAGANADAQHLVALVHALGPNPDIRMLIALMEEVGPNPNIQHLIALIDTVAANGTIAELTALMGAVQGHNAGTAVTAVTGLVNAVAARGTTVELTALVNAVAANGTIAELTALVGAVQGHNAGTAVTAVTMLVNVASNPAHVCVDLTALINAIQNNGVVPQTTLLVQQSVMTLGVGNTNDLLPLINRNRAQNNPPHVRTFLIALYPNTRVRYQRIQPKIQHFIRAGGAPNHGTVQYARHGYIFRCNRWDHFYERHSYPYYDFRQTLNWNDIFAPGTNMLTVLNNTFPNNLPAVTVLAEPGNTSVDTGAVRIGVSHTLWVTQLYPTGWSNEKFCLSEMNAIENLR